MEAEIRSRAAVPIALGRLVGDLLNRPVGRAGVYAALACLAAGGASVIIHSYIASFSGKADAYCVGEWLINYAGGFVRRGLGGTAIFRAHDLFGIRPRVAVFALLVVCYSITFYAWGLALARTRGARLLDLLLVLSPFAALFPAFHGVAGQRKEVLLFALLGVAYLTDLGALDSLIKYVFWSVALALMVAINDGVVFFVPLVLLYLRVSTPPQCRIGWRAPLLALPAAAVFLLGYLFSGRADIEAICAAMQNHEPAAWCTPQDGVRFTFAAAWLAATALDGMRSVAGRYTLLSASLTVLVGLIGLLPVAFALSKESAALRAWVRDLAPPPLFVAACLIGMLFLFAVANDWNRWFYITTSLLTMVYFAARKTTSGG